MPNRRGLLAGAAALGLCSTRRGLAQPDPGVLRAVMLEGNPVLTRMDPQGQAQGPAVDMAQALARRLGRKLQVAFTPKIPDVLDRVRKGDGDVGFIAYDPSRADGVIFTPPYLMSLNRFGVRAGSPILTQDQVDRPGVKVAIVNADAGALFLQRNAHAASLVVVADFAEGLDRLRAGAVDVMAANGQRLADAIAAKGGLQILPGSFFAVPQAMAVRADDPLLAALASEVVRDMLASGEVASSIARWNLTGAAPAPAPS